MPQKQKPEEKTRELNGQEKVVVAVYLLQNVKERFELTENENGALDYALYLFERERGWLEEEENGSVLEIEEDEDEVEKMPNQPGLPPILKVAKKDIEGYA